MRRLLSLDYVIERTGLPWLATEHEKVGAFEALGIERASLPVRVYRGAAGATRRYFRSNCPSRWTRAAPCSSTSIPATTPRPRSAPGARRTLGSGTRSRDKAGLSRSSPSRAPRGSSSEPDAGIREELARIERAILQGAVQILEEFGGLRATMKHSVVLEEAGAPPARTRVHPAGQHLADGASRGGALPMTGARLTAALECANDAGGRFTLWPSGDAHACYGVSHDTATSCAFAAGSLSAARAALTGTGATPQSEGLVRVRRQVCLRTPAAVPSGSLPANYPYAGRRFSAASRRRSTSSIGGQDRPPEPLSTRLQNNLPIIAPDS